LFEEFLNTIFAKSIDKDTLMHYHGIIVN